MSFVGAASVVHLGDGDIIHDISGQFFLRPHEPTDFPQKVAFWKGIPRKFQENPGW